MKVFWVFAFIFFSQCASASWDLNDVSYLFPLPVNKAEVTKMIGPLERVDGAPILPISMILPSGGGISHYDSLRVVAFRYDPEHSEFKLIWQPIEVDETGFTSEDEAVHTFHRLNGVENRDMKDALFTIKVELLARGISTDQKALGIHPSASSDASRTFFLDSATRVIRRFLGQDHFYKFTVMKLLVPGNWWKFYSAMEKDQHGNWAPAQIARHGGTEMDIINDASSGDEVDASLFVLSSTLPPKDDLRFIVSTSFRSTSVSGSPDQSDRPAFARGLGAINRIQNPFLSNPKTIDCAHCHIANAAESFALKTFPDLREDFLKSTERFRPKGKYDITNQSVNPHNSKAVRAFGYFENQPSILTRTIFESAQVADFLNVLDRGKLSE